MPFGLNGAPPPAPMTWKKGGEEGKGRGRCRRGGGGYAGDRAQGGATAGDRYSPLGGSAHPRRASGTEAAT